MFDIDASNGAPIWRQIEEGMRRMISLGHLEAGSAVPSVRDLAQQLRVNPNTVARAYQRLSDTGVFTVRRGEGTFVADRPAKLPGSERTAALREAAVRFANVALTVGAGPDEAIEHLEKAFERAIREHQRRTS